MKPAVILLAASFLVFSFASKAEETPEDRKLLEALKADDFDAREAAKKKLIERGEAIRALVVKELEAKNIDPDYKEHLKAISAKLKDSDVMKAFDAPTRIDLELKDAPIAEAFDKVKAQFGLGVALKDDANKKKVTVSIKGATFLEAVEAIRKSAGLSYDRNDLMQMRVRVRGGIGAIFNKDKDEDAVLTLRDLGEKSDAVPAGAKGPVVLFLELVQNTSTKSRRFGQGGGNAGGDAQKNFNVSGYMLLEPGLRCSGIGVKDMKASGGKDTSLTAGHVSLYNYSSMTGEDARKGLQVYNFNANLNTQAELPSTLSYKLTAKLQVPVKMTEKRFENLPEIVGKAQDLMGGTFTLKKLEAGGRGWKIVYETTGALMDMGSSGRGMAMRFNGNDGENMTGGNPEFAMGMSIVDAQGKPVQSGGFSGSGNGTTYKVEMDVSTEPKTIVFRKPGETATREFELEIKDVPVP